MIYAIGDIHGQRNLLSRLLDELLPRLEEDDTVVFLGDYIDRGPDSRGVLDLLVDFSSEVRMVLLRGNHEDLALRARNGFQPLQDEHGLYVAENDPVRHWLTEGGDATLRSYGLDLDEASDEEFEAWVSKIPEPHWLLLEHCELEWKQEHWWFVHAGILPAGMLWEYDGFGLDPRLWVREPFLSYRGDFDGRRVVFGHTPQHNGKALQMPNKLGIDTGAAYGGPLTAAVLEEDGKTLGFLRALDAGVSFSEGSSDV